MKIMEALKSTAVRLSKANRWMIWDVTYKEWVVYGREYGQRKTRTIVTTGDEVEAVRFLLYKEEK